MSRDQTQTQADQAVFRVLSELIKGAAGVAALITVVAIIIHFSGVNEVFSAGLSEPWLLVTEIFAGLVITWLVVLPLGMTFQALSYKLPIPPVVKES